MDTDSVTRIINTWDPIHLFPHAPDNEYHREISSIVAIVSSTDEVYILAQGIQQIFAKAFGSVFRRDFNDCLTIATQILQEKKSMQAQFKCSL